MCIYTASSVDIVFGGNEFKKSVLTCLTSCLLNLFHAGYIYASNKYGLYDTKKTFHHVIINCVPITNPIPFRKRR